MASGKAGKSNHHRAATQPHCWLLFIESLCVGVEACCHTKEHFTSEVGTGIHVLLSMYLYDEEL